MSPTHPSTPDPAWIAAERSRLVRLCARITGDSASAEDLAQETLIEAWRHAGNLRDPGAREAWLTGIARNVCRRWARARSRQHRSPMPATNVAGDLVDWPDDRVDLDLELEREELAELLDRALTLLPHETRVALVQHYVDDAPQARIAEQLGLSQGAVAMRLSRGKLALRRILATEFRDEVQAFEPGRSPTDAWAETRVWCTLCGTQRLTGRFDPVDGTLVLRCPTCFHSFGLHQVQSFGLIDLYRSAESVAAAYRLLLGACHDYYAQAVRDTVAPCPGCGAEATLHRQLPASVLPRLRESHGMHMHCSGCNRRFHVSLGGLILCQPTARDFWWTHRRIIAHPEREIVVDGRPALVSRLASVTSGATLDIITDRDHLTPLCTYANGRDVSHP